MQSLENRFKAETLTYASGMDTLMSGSDLKRMIGPGGRFSNCSPLGMSSEPRIYAIVVRHIVFIGVTLSVLIPQALAFAQCELHFQFTLFYAFVLCLPIVLRLI